MILFGCSVSAVYSVSLNLDILKLEKKHAKKSCRCSGVLGAFCQAHHLEFSRFTRLGIDTRKNGRRHVQRRQ